ncbi:hypothetical protein HZB89_02280 [archaeon]|nr:hypothetical protein [archaeon]
MLINVYESSIQKKAVARLEVLNKAALAERPEARKYARKKLENLIKGRIEARKIKQANKALLELISKSKKVHHAILPEGIKSAVNKIHDIRQGMSVGVPLTLAIGAPAFSIGPIALLVPAGGLYLGSKISLTKLNKAYQQLREALNASRDPAITELKKQGKYLIIDNDRNLCAVDSTRLQAIFKGQWPWKRMKTE